MLAARVVLGLALAIAVAMPPIHAQQLADQQILRRGNGSEPATLDPHRVEAVNDSLIEDDLFEGLVTIGKDNKPKPGAAESWTISPDGKVYSFKLRADLKWSNGDPLTAQDFAYSFRRAVDPATGSRYGFLYYPVKNAEDIIRGKIKDISELGVRALDPLTFEVTLNAPTGYFLGMLAHNVFFPVEKSNVEKFGAEFTRAGNLVSNGAFTLKEWTPQSRVVVIKNPNFHDADKVRLTEVDFFPIESQNEELKRYRAGELDVTYPSGLPGDQMDFIKQTMASELALPPLFATYYLDFNLTRAPFKDAQKLRTALSMVIDREIIVNKIKKEGQQPAYSFIPPGIPGYEAQSVSWKDLPMAERIAQAKKLYAEAGYSPDHPLKVELRYNTSETHKQIMIAIAAMWKQALGVQTSLLNEEFKVFLDTRAQRKVTEATRDGWSGDYLDPNAFAQLMLSSSGLNYAGYNNPEYDELVEKAAATVDAAERLSLLGQAEKLILRDVPVVPLYYYVNGYLAKPYVQGFGPNLLGMIYSKRHLCRSALSNAVIRCEAISRCHSDTVRHRYNLVLHDPVGAGRTVFQREGCTAGNQANLDRVYHLDQSLPVQYAHYLGNVLQGDFGPSFSYKDFTVTQLIQQGFPVSLQLGLTAMLLAVIAGTLLGTLAALRQNRPPDYAVMAVAMTGITIPNFVMAPLLTLVIGVYLHWLPVGGWGDGHQLQYKILPVVALALPQIAYIARLTRGSMIEVLRSNYIRTARAKGLDSWTTVTRHAAPAAMLPVVSYLGPASAGIITGSVVVEQIFSVPGIGRYFVQAALNRDYTLVMGVVIFYGVLIILFNLLVDILYGVLDPKLAHP